MTPISQRRETLRNCLYFPSQDNGRDQTKGGTQPRFGGLSSDFEGFSRVPIGISGKVTVKTSHRCAHEGALCGAGWGQHNWKLALSGLIFDHFQIKNSKFHPVTPKAYACSFLSPSSAPSSSSSFWSRLSRNESMCFSLFPLRSFSLFFRATFFCSIWTIQSDSSNWLIMTLHDDSWQIDAAMAKLDGLKARSA